LADGFQRRRLKCEKLTDAKSQECMIRPSSPFIQYLYPIFSLKKILYSYIIFVRSGLTPCCGLLHNGLTEKKVIFLQFTKIERKAFTGIHIIVKHCILYSTFYGRPKWRKKNSIFQLYRGDQFIGGGNQSTRRKPLTCCKSLTNFIT
jgi:hypothetical protein